MGKNTVQANQWLDKCYSDSAPSEITVKKWYADFKCGRTDKNDAECSGCPNLAVVPENTKNLHKFILSDPNVDMKVRLTVALDKRGFICVWRAGQ